MRSPSALYYLLLLFISFSCLAAQEAVVVKQVPLQVSPGAISQAVETLEKDSQVTILKRKGAWYQVVTATGTEGWLKMIAVRYTTQSGPKKPRSLLLGITETTTSTGIRGVSEEELGSAEFEDNPQSLKKSDVTRDEAESHAREGDLEKRSIEYQQPN